ncbi:MAG: LacI family transcriptional regulator [Spirochaetes bacterium]|nr:MAG: LacI family transcriptional regulator [Spirochaetota bacterium]
MGECRLFGFYRGLIVGITIKDIARFAGVSKSTVSMVINNDPSIPERTKERIREIMLKYNYYPNSRAKQLASRKSFSLGIVVDIRKKESFWNPYFYSMIGGAESFLCSHDYCLTIANINSTKNKDHFLSRFVYNRRVDGIIIPSYIITPEISDQLESIGFPFVLVGESREYSRVNQVDINNKQAGELAVKHLVENGYTQIAFIGGNTSETMTINRFEGYRKGLKLMNIHEDPSIIKLGGGNEEAGQRHMRELIDSAYLPEAVICINNYVAYGALSVLHKSGIKIPEQIGIVTFDDYPLSPYMNPPLTSLIIDTFQLGYMAAELLLELIENPDKDPEKVLIPASITPRESTRKEAHLKGTGTSA